MYTYIMHMHTLTVQIDIPQEYSVYKYTCIKDAHLLDKQNQNGAVSGDANIYSEIVIQAGAVLFA